MHTPLQHPQTAGIPVIFPGLLSGYYLQSYGCHAKWSDSVVTFNCGLKFPLFPYCARRP